MLYRRFRVTWLYSSHPSIHLHLPHQCCRSWYRHMKLFDRPLLHPPSLLCVPAFLLFPSLYLPITSFPQVLERHAGSDVIKESETLYWVTTTVSCLTEEDWKPIFMLVTPSISLVISIYFHRERELSHLLVNAQPEPTANQAKITMLREETTTQTVLKQWWLSLHGLHDSFKYTVKAAATLVWITHPLLHTHTHTFIHQSKPQVS